MKLRIMEFELAKECEHEDSFNDQSAQGVAIRGTRKKRPLPAAGTTTTSSASSAEFSSGVTEEEEEEEEYMANCLMLLSRGLVGGNATPASRCRSRGYECKTCNKSFPSFQALGGHRANHKPRAAPETASELRLQSAAASTVAVSGLLGSNEVRLHECSICGSKFSSGQALGGHMRRHRPVATAAKTAPKTKKEQVHVFPLDLNLPAPSDDDKGGKCQLVLLDNMPKKE